MISASYLNNDHFWLNKFCKSDTFVSYIEFIEDMRARLKKLYWEIGCQCIGKILIKINMKVTKTKYFNFIILYIYNYIYIL